MPIFPAFGVLLRLPFGSRHAWHLRLIGLQWGDEAKGKIVDLLTREHDFVVRYQGGHRLLTQKGPEGKPGEQKGTFCFTRKVECPLVCP